MSHLVISKKNEVYLNVQAEPHVYYELADQFTFDLLTIELVINKPDVEILCLSCIQK